MRRRRIHDRSAKTTNIPRPPGPPSRSPAAYRTGNPRMPAVPPTEAASPRLPRLRLLSRAESHHPSVGGSKRTARVTTVDRVRATVRYLSVCPAADATRRHLRSLADHEAGTRRCLRQSSSPIAGRLPCAYCEPVANWASERSACTLPRIEKGWRFALRMKRSALGPLRQERAICRFPASSAPRS